MAMIDRSITHVVAVARAGSFTAAAGQLGLSQSAVTRSIADLEKRLGYQIFVRTGRGAVLTEDGCEFVDRASRLLEDAESLFHGPKNRRDPYADVLRLGMCPKTLEWMLVDPLSLVLARHPLMRMHITGGLVERVIQQLRSSAIDVAFGFESDLGDQADFKIFPLPPLSMSMCVRRGHPILELETVTAADMAKYPIVAPTDSRTYSAFVRGIYESQGIDSQSQIHLVDFQPLMTRILASTDAVSFASPKYADESFDENFVLISYFDPVPAAAVCCAIRTKWEPRPIVREFIKACRETMGLTTPII